MDTTDRKATAVMNLKELRDELHERAAAVGDEPPVVSGSKEELRERVQGLRDAEQAVPPVTASEAEARDAIGDERLYDDEQERFEASQPETAFVPPEVADEVSQAIALREATVAPALALPTPQEFNAAMKIAETIAMSRVVPEAYRGRPDDVLAAILYGREIGLGPMTALRDVYMIEGRAAVAAHRQLGLLRRGGVVILESDSNDDLAYIVAQRTDTDEVMRVEFTYEEAEKIKRKGKPLVDGDNWRNYRKDMLWARCVGRLTRRLGPDLIGGLPPYVAEEVADFEGWGVDYGSQGELATRKTPVPEYRKEKPDYNWPLSWPELAERLGLVIGAQHDVAEWVKQAVMAVYSVETVQGMPIERKRVMFQKLSGVLFTLDELNLDIVFAPDPRKIVRDAFAKYLEGEVLEGPPWRIGPTEDDRPAYESLAVDEPIDGEVLAEEDAAADEPIEGEDPSIEFGV